MFNATVDDETQEDLRTDLSLATLGTAAGRLLREGELGYRFSGALRLQTSLTPSFRVGLIHNQPLDDRTTSGSFNGLAGGAFTSTGDDDAELQVTAGVGVDFKIGTSTSLFAGYDIAFGNRTLEHTVNGGLRFSW